LLLSSKSNRLRNLSNFHPKSLESFKSLAHKSIAFCHTSIAFCDWLLYLAPLWLAALWLGALWLGALWLATFPQTQLLLFQK